MSPLSINMVFQYNCDKNSHTYMIQCFSSDPKLSDLSEHMLYLLKNYYDREESIWGFLLEFSYPDGTHFMLQGDW